VSDLAGLIDQIFVGAEGDVSHECSVHYNRAHCKQLRRGFQTGFFTAVYRHHAGRFGDDLKRMLAAFGNWRVSRSASQTLCGGFSRITKA
jgi:hypothetical protein